MLKMLGVTKTVFFPPIASVSDNTVDDVQDPRMSRINLVQRAIKIK